MITEALYWQAPCETARPGWLEGCHNVQNAGCYWWVGSPVVRPNFDKCKWLPTAKGWKVAQCDPSIDLSPYLRERRWHNPLEVVDTRGRSWFIPAMLTPDGVPAVAQTRRRVNGEWVREYVDDAQEAAVEAALAIRANAELTLDEQSDSMLAIIETAYHLDAETVAVMGFLDDVIVCHGLRKAAGVHPIDMAA